MPDALIRQLHFKDMVIAAKSGFACENATDLFLENVHIITGKQPVFETNGCKNIQITE